MNTFAGRFAQLEETIRQCAAFARDNQRRIHRFYKSDGSVLTETDLEISARVGQRIAQLFPHDTFICEETPIVRRDESEYIFVLDPIDGTDVYSQGLPSYAVALGILGRDRRPVGAIIAAPRFGIGREDLFISLCPGGALYVDGEVFSASPDKDRVSQVTMGSTDQARVDFSHFNGKVRTFGSSIIHLVSPVVFSSMQGCVNQPCYVWDIAASHAVLLSQGMDIRYCDGSAFEYTDDFLYEKRKYRMDIYAGTPKGIQEMMTTLPVRV